MKRTMLYAFVGTSAAVKSYLSNASPAPSADALDASAQLESVSQQLLEAACRDASDEELKAILETRVADVMEAVEALRKSGTMAGFDATLNWLLEYFYNVAESIMGGGGSTTPLTKDVWPSSAP